MTPTKLASRFSPYSLLDFANLWIYLKKKKERRKKKNKRSVWLPLVVRKVLKTKLKCLTE